MDKPKERWVGVDWSRGHHDVCVLDEHGQVLLERRFAHDGAELRQMCELLAKHGEPATIAVAIETPRGPVVETLLERGFGVWSVNPKQLDRFRDRFSVAGSKNDRLDARVLADSLRTDQGCFQRLEQQEPTLLELRECSRLLDELQHERTRGKQRLQEQLWRYFPALLELGDDVSAEWFLELWQKVPTPQHARSVKPEELESVLRRVRRLKAAQVLERLRAEPLAVRRATTEAAQAHTAVLVAQLRLLNEQYREALRRLKRLNQQWAREKKEKTKQRDVEILASLPGVGPIVLATLCAEAQQPLRERNYHALRALSGVAPITRRSGKSLQVQMRRGCDGRLRQATYHWARIAVQKDPLSRHKYRALRARGKPHGSALRSVADRLLFVACTLLRSGQLYDPTHSTAVLESARQRMGVAAHPLASANGGLGA